MIMCPSCHENFIDGDRVQANVPRTFVFKPADVDDVKIVHKNKFGQPIEISAAAVLAPDALADSRSEHKKTVIATMFFTYGKVETPKDAANVRHVACAVRRTGERFGTVHPAHKHEVRFQRSALRKQ